MKIITLIDNNTFNPELETEHGLSVYIETDKHKILFDTGKSEIFIRNAEKLNVNLRDVDTVVISHGHYDHIGGLISFLNLNKTAKVFLNKEIFDYQYYSIRGGIQSQSGWSEELMKYENRFVLIKDELLIEDELIFISNIKKKYQTPKGNQMLFKSKGDEMEQDDFQHELIFCLDTPSGLSVFGGCAHNGITNILHTVNTHFPEKKINLIFGGMHLIDEKLFSETESASELMEIGHEINRLAEDALIFTGHCTCENAKDEIRKVLGSGLQSFSTGHEIEIP